jgi:O-acetyl-ADP-ribose deacetylase (regulator of RNase III)
VSEQLVKAFLDGRVRVMRGDITRQQVDALVNAANSSLMGGAGVDGAIHRAGGPRILEECQEIRRTLYPDGLPTGGAVITTGGNLAALHVVHTVGPVYGQHNGREAELLGMCYQNSLALASVRRLKSIAFPAISTGAYGYPRTEAAAVSSEAIKSFLADDQRVAEVRLIFFLPEDMQLFLKNQKF